MISLLFILCFVVCCGLIVYVFLNIRSVISVDTLTNGADTLLGDNPINTTQNNITSFIKRHLIAVAGIAITGLCSVALGIAWIVQTLA